MEIGGKNDLMTDPKKYCQIVESLITLEGVYEMTCTRSDISWTVSKLSQKLSCHRVEDMVAAKHGLRCLRGTIDYELCFKKCDGDLQLNLVAYSDSDWASSLEDIRSTTGYCLSLSNRGHLYRGNRERNLLLLLPLVKPNL